jgi:alkylation response protein AidB-like acyl-CoA dehydrogenase
VFIVLAETPGKSENGEIEDKVTTFILEGDPGLTFCSSRKIMEIKALNAREISFNNVKVPVENVLGEVGGGLEVAMNILNDRSFGMAGALSGTIRTVIQKAIEQTCGEFHEK